MLLAGTTMGVATALPRGPNYYKAPPLKDLRLTTAPAIYPTVRHLADFLVDLLTVRALQEHREPWEGRSEASRRSRLELC